MTTATTQHSNLLLNCKPALFYTKSNWFNCRIQQTLRTPPH